MKKIVVGLVIAVAAVIAFTMLTDRGTTAEEKKQITVKTEQAKPGEKVIIKEKDKGVGESTITTTKITEKPGDVKVKQKTEYEKGVPMKKGYLKECDAVFQKRDEEKMHAYFMKDNELYRLKYPENMKQNVLKMKKGDKVHVWSTYELSPEQLKKYAGQENVLHKCETVK